MNGHVYIMLCFCCMALQASDQDHVSFDQARAKAQRALSIQWYKDNDITKRIALQAIADRKKTNKVEVVAVQKGSMQQAVLINEDCHVYCQNSLEMRCICEL